ncbi:MAG: hypothetical protein ACI38A_03755 [Candidatus Ornithomonoglobus sp.]
MDINELLGSFNENQLKQINNFIGSVQGQKMSGGLSNSDKERLLSELGRLDADTVRRKLSSLSGEDILKILK